MEFIVPPEVEEAQELKTSKVITLCAKCSEDPRFCGDPI
jgi:hypothetical protein